MVGCLVSPFLATRIELNAEPSADHVDGLSFGAKDAELFDGNYLLGFSS